MFNNAAMTMFSLLNLLDKEVLQCKSVRKEFWRYKRGGEGFVGLVTPTSDAYARMVWLGCTFQVPWYKVPVLFLG